MAAPPVVVLDTNVLESALRSRRGASFALLSQVGLGAFEIAVSVPLVLEYEAVLLREPNRKAATINDLVDFLCAVAVRQTIFFRWRPYLPDPGDDMLLELAVAARCRYIITYNRRHFVGTDRFGIRVLRPAAFLKQLAGGS